MMTSGLVSSLAIVVLTTGPMWQAGSAAASSSPCATHSSSAVATAAYPSPPPSPPSPPPPPPPSSPPAQTRRTYSRTRRRRATAAVEWPAVTASGDCTRELMRTSSTKRMCTIDLRVPVRKRIGKSARGPRRHDGACGVPVSRSVGTVSAFSASSTHCRANVCSAGTGSTLPPPTTARLMRRARSPNSMALCGCCCRLSSAGSQ
mmetsp:Transcript_31017/g.75899  ORF Transcript_31017/g.75899 Transcript_31017/m.75899 type:complete len:204 (-) Transcript_31017:37-648(-)